MFSVMVLGAGPAGLLAADTAVRHGANVVLVSKAYEGRPLKSELYGCQYLHYPVIEGLGYPVEVKYSMEGTPEEYRQKVYGDNWNGTVSPDEYGPMEGHFAWDIRKMYDKLWGFWSHRIYPIDKQMGLNAGSLKDMIDKAHFDLVISTVPAPAICIQRFQGTEPVEENPHSFPAQTIYAIGETPNRTIPIPCEDSSVVYNGTRDTGWYRKARVFGRTTVEWPYMEKRPPFNGVVPVQKPLSTNCDCWLTGEHEGRFMKVGRYGRWQKGYLVHQVQQDVGNVMKNHQLRLV